MLALCAAMRGSLPIADLLFEADALLRMTRSHSLAAGSNDVMTGPRTYQEGGFLRLRGARARREQTIPPISCRLISAYPQTFVGVRFATA